VPRSPKFAVPIFTAALVVAAVAWCLYMGMGFDEFRARHGHDHHHHAAPHGGTLFVLGLHSAHVELVFDPATTRLDLYALDGHAEEIFPLRADPIGIDVRAHETAPWVPVVLTPSEDPAERPTPQFAVRFTATVPELSGVPRFEVRLPDLEIAGTRYRGLSSWFPEGNE
jgi:hypothetical protein